MDEPVAKQRRKQSEQTRCKEYDHGAMQQERDNCPRAAERNVRNLKRGGRGDSRQSWQLNQDYETEFMGNTPQNQSFPETAGDTELHRGRDRNTSSARRTGGYQQYQSRRGSRNCQSSDFDRNHLQSQSHKQRESEPVPGASRQSECYSEMGRGGHTNTERPWRNPGGQQQQQQFQRVSRNYRGGSRFGGQDHRHQFHKQKDADFQLSKTMAFILRHGARECNISMASDGYVFVNDLLAYKGLQRRYTENDVIRVVDNNNKKRFLSKRDKDGNLLVRANQGHTVEVADLELRPVTDADDIPVVVHGTYERYWSAIKSKGLSRMERNHIHFATGQAGESQVISGMRSSSEIMIYINAELAIKDGLRFYISANGVILSPGNADGVILPKYFKQAILRKTGERLL